MTDLVHVDSEKPEDLIQMAQRLGIGRLILVKEVKNQQDVKKWKSEFSRIKSDIDLVLGVELSAKRPADIEKIASHVRKDVEIIIVSGGEYDINRAAVENSKIDILMHPEDERTDRGMDEYLFKEAKKNGVIIGISFRRILESYKKSRAFKLSFVTQNVRLIDQKNVTALSDAYNRWEMRPDRDRDDFILSLTKKRIDSSKNLEEKIRLNRKKMKQVHEGLRVVE